ncbi:hypothetical protein GOV10_02345, partial [Candidatus Woesearchaeota archaeon]|nr:hypothetical protein [Candidatus Woesearchaeota archaeon]
MAEEIKTENLDELIAEQFTPEKRLLPRPVGLSLPVFQHPIAIEDAVTSFRNHVEHFVKEVTPLITEDCKYTNVPKDLRKPEGETEPVFDYEGAVQIFDLFYEIQNRRLILGHEDKDTDLALGRLYGAGYSLGRLLLAEELLKRDDPAYHREQKHNLISEILFQYANIGLQETIILRNRHEEAKDA